MLKLKLSQVVAQCEPIFSDHLCVHRNEEEGVKFQCLKCIDNRSHVNGCKKEGGRYIKNYGLDKIDEMNICFLYFHLLAKHSLKS